MNRHEERRPDRPPAGPFREGGDHEDEPPRRGRRNWAFGGDRRGHPVTTPNDRLAIEGWFVGNLSDGWFVGTPEVTVDDYEILVVGELAPPEGVSAPIQLAAEDA